MTKIALVRDTVNAEIILGALPVRHDWKLCPSVTFELRQPETVTAYQPSDTEGRVESKLDTVTIERGMCAITLIGTKNCLVTQALKFPISDIEILRRIPEFIEFDL